MEWTNSGNTFVPRAILAQGSSQHLSSSRLKFVTAVVIRGRAMADPNAPLRRLRQQSELCLLMLLLLISRRKMISFATCASVVLACCLGLGAVALLYTPVVGIPTSCASSVETSYVPRFLTPSVVV